MRGLKAGLLMLGKARAVEVIEGVTDSSSESCSRAGRAYRRGFMDRLPTLSSVLSTTWNVQAAAAIPVHARQRKGLRCRRWSISKPRFYP